MPIVAGSLYPRLARGIGTNHLLDEAAASSMATDHEELDSTQPLRKTVATTSMLDVFTEGIRTTTSSAYNRPECGMQQVVLFGPHQQTCWINGPALMQQCPGSFHLKGSE